MPDLPARDMASAQLSRLLALPGCPGCHEQRQVVERYTEAFLYESVNDVRFRADLDAARGMCGPHVRAMLAADRRTSGGMLGPAILLDAMLRVRLAELLAAVGTPRPIRSRRLRDAARPAACPVCREASSTVDATLRHLVRQTDDPGWADAVAQADLCLEHLVTMMSAPDRPPAWAGVERRQLERLAGLRRLLVGHADHAAHDRRHLATTEERASVDEAARLLGGDPGDRQTPLPRHARGGRDARPDEGP